MARWNLLIPEETNRILGEFLARADGENRDLSAYVDHADRQALFWDTVENIQERNTALSPDEPQALADEAVAETRANPA